MFKRFAWWLLHHRKGCKEKCFRCEYYEICRKDMDAKWMN
jgi:hypothetical protein